MVVKRQKPQQPKPTTPQQHHLAKIKQRVADHPDKQAHIEQWGVYKTPDGGYRATALESTSALSALPPKIACSAGKQGKRAYRAHIEISHGLTGKKLDDPVRVISPTVTTSLPADVVRDAIEAFLHKWVFDMYIRVVGLSRARLNACQTTPYHGNVLDRELTQNPFHAVVDLGLLPEGVHAVAYPPMHKIVHELVEKMFLMNHTTFISREDIKRFYREEDEDSSSSSGSSSSSSSDDDEEEEG